MKMTPRLCFDCDHRFTSTSRICPACGGTGQDDPADPAPLAAALAVDGMTHARLARLLGVSRITVTRWNTGERRIVEPAATLLAIIGDTPRRRWPRIIKDRWDAPAS